MCTYNMVCFPRRRFSKRPHHCIDIDIQYDEHYNYCVDLICEIFFVNNKDFQKLNCENLVSGFVVMACVTL